MEKPQTIRRLKVTVHGAVQGVGFRPFVYRLASELGLCGWVANSTQGLLIEVEGGLQPLESFLSALTLQKPARSFIQSSESVILDPKGYFSFKILESRTEGQKTALVMPDIAICDKCLSEIFDRGNRRCHYPFTNCTNCGPRYSLMEALPYDRHHTTMKNFSLCEACQAEYEDPTDRRYHAQPNACPHCGPHCELWDLEGRIFAKHDEALLKTVKLILKGQIAAVKGLGGFHLMVDATNENAVNRLRQQKHRQEKPFALMMPTLEMTKHFCEVSMLEEGLLCSPEAPIVLLRAKKDVPLGVSPIVHSVAPRNPNLGVMLPYTPLHHLLMRELNIPVIATSGNLSEEPIVTDEYEAVRRLTRVADFFLVHNRPIARPVDDSIVRVINGRRMVLRRARGFAPLPFYASDSDKSILAVGAHLKNTVAQSIGGQIFVSQHVGDLGTEESWIAFTQAAKSFEKLYSQKPDLVAFDIHPGYPSTRFAEGLGLPEIRVQHHYAHCLSCMMENEVENPVLGIAWDGTGDGDDGTIWGGEFLRIGSKGFERLAHFRTFRLPSSEQAVHEPRRSALGLLYEIFEESLFEMKNMSVVSKFSAVELMNLKSLLKKGLYSPKTSSAGRLFDAVASILGLCQIHDYEGQAAMQLEFAIDGQCVDEKYSIKFFKNDSSWIFDWEPMIREILADLNKGVHVGEIALKFHNTLAETILNVAALSGEKKIVLSGGCFQNKYLLERTIKVLTAEGFSPYWHQRIPTNDGGISLGQISAALRHLKKHKELPDKKEETMLCA
ncbi:MAG: carbamoyltransferase HypF [Candidatus Omnitrophica bacterium CG1_02_46_14]|nr:MAG: carbamoyltransferase HypF [Candidatus Omnitrophica bacterium CG1_02_46_14]